MSIAFYSLEDTKQKLGKNEKELKDLAQKGHLNMVEDDGEVWFSAADVDELRSADQEVLPAGGGTDDVSAILSMPKRLTKTEIDEPIALEPEESVPEQDGMSKIKAFGGTGISASREALDTSGLKRKVNVTGQGATRCRTFHAKLNDSSLAYLNNQINEWADSDPQIEIKFATTSVGVVEGKHAEQHLLVTVFY